MVCDYGDEWMEQRGKDFQDWYCCQRCFEEEKWVYWNGYIYELRKINEWEIQEIVGKWNDLRIVRFVNADWSSDFNELWSRLIVTWSGNEDEEGLKKCYEKGEVIEGVRRNRGEFVATQIT